MKRVAIFGSTGSIGTQTLEVIQKFPEDFKVTVLTAQKNESLLKAQAKEWKAHGQLGLDGLNALVQNADYIVNAVPGFDGLRVSIAALEAGKILLSANKESLAIAGRWLRELPGTIFPLDSEASAVWQLMHEHGPEKISSVTLTCSGGPFLGRTDLEKVTVKEALAHPTWKMGAKVSLDSATLINKVLEVYETHQLFDIPLKDIHIVVHPQSIVHGMVHTKTGATRMHITQNDMRLFISYALHYPTQPKCPWPIERTRKSKLDFQQPDAQTFRSLQWLKMHRGNPNFPIVLNAMNDVATQAFLDGQLKFLQIYDLIEEGLERWLWEVPPKSLNEMIQFHENICNFARQRVLDSSRAKQTTV